MNPTLVAVVMVICARLAQLGALVLRLCHRHRTLIMPAALRPHVGNRDRRED